MKMIALFAQVTGASIVHQLGVLLVVAICILILWWLGKLLFPKLGAPAVVLTAWDGLFILLGGFFVINLLLGFIGHALIPW